MNILPHQIVQIIDIFEFGGACLCLGLPDACITKTRPWNIQIFFELQKLNIFRTNILIFVFISLKKKKKKKKKCGEHVRTAVLTSTHNL